MPVCCDGSNSVLGIFCKKALQQAVIATMLYTLVVMSVKTVDRNKVQGWTGEYEAACGMGWCVS